MKKILVNCKTMISTFSKQLLLDEFILPSKNDWFKRNILKLLLFNRLKNIHYRLQKYFICILGVLFNSLVETYWRLDISWYHLKKYIFIFWIFMIFSSTKLFKKCEYDLVMKNKTKRTVWLPFNFVF